MRRSDGLADRVNEIASKQRHDAQDSRMKERLRHFTRESEVWELDRRRQQLSPALVSRLNSVAKHLLLHGPA
jgi:hypothetical protein